MCQRLPVNGHAGSAWRCPSFLATFLAGDRVEPGISLDDDTILMAIPFSELTRRAFHMCDLVFRRNQSSSYACATGRFVND